jgi:hypothetical protein
MPNPIDSCIKDRYHQNPSTILETYHHVIFIIRPFLAFTGYVRETSHLLAPEHSSHKRGTLLI